MSWNYQQQVFDSQSSFANAGQWRDGIEPTDNHPEGSPNSYGYNPPQAASMEYDIRVEIEPREPISYDYHRREFPQGDSFNGNDRSDLSQNDYQFRPYRPQNQQTMTELFDHGSEARNDFNVRAYDYSQGQDYQMQVAQRPGMDGLQQQQHGINPTQTNDVGVEPYAPYQAYRSNMDLTYDREPSQHPQTAPQNLGFGIPEPNDNLPPISNEYRDDFTFEGPPNMLPGLNKTDRTSFATDKKFDTLDQPKDMKSPELTFTSAPALERDDSASSERKFPASARSSQVQAPMPSMQQNDRPQDSSSENELTPGSSLPLDDQNEHALAQPSPEQRARWELIRSLVKGHDQGDKQERKESRDTSGSPGPSPRASQNQPQQETVPAPSPSKGMRTLMLPQMVERRKSMDASSGGKNVLSSPNQGQKGREGPQAPSQPQPASSTSPQGGKLANQPSTAKQPGGPPMPSASSSQVRSRPSTPSGPPKSTNIPPVSSGGPRGSGAYIPPTSHVAPNNAQRYQQPQQPPQSQGQQRPPASTGGTPSKPPLPPRASLEAAPLSVAASSNQAGGHGPNQAMPLKTPNSAQKPLSGKATGPPSSGAQNQNNTQPTASPAPSTTKSPPNPAKAPLQSSQARKAVSTPGRLAPTPAESTPQSQPVARAAPAQSQPRKPVPRAAAAPLPTKAPPQGPVASQPLTPHAGPKYSSPNPASSARPVAGAPMPASRTPQPQTPQPSPKPPQASATMPTASSKVATSPLGALPVSAPQQNAKAEHSVARAAPTSHTTSVPQNPIKFGGSSHPPPATAPPSQSKLAGQSLTPQHGSLPQRATPQGPSAASHPSTTQQPSAQQHTSINQTGAPATAHGLPPDPAAAPPEEQPSRKQGSLGRSGAVFRRGTPQGATSAPGAPRSSAQSENANGPSIHSNPSRERRNSSSRSNVVPDKSDADDKDSPEEAEQQPSKTFSGVLDQLAASEEAGEEADPELEANNLVHRKSRQQSHNPSPSRTLTII